MHPASKVLYVLFDMWLMLGFFFVLAVLAGQLSPIMLIWPTIFVPLIFFMIWILES